MSLYTLHARDNIASYGECYKDKRKSSTDKLEFLFSKCVMRDDSYVQALPDFCSALNDLGKLMK